MAKAKKAQAVIANPADVSLWPVYSHGARTRGRFGASSVAPWTAIKARNGNPILPEEVYRVLLEECAKHPGPAKHDTFGEVLNATAWRTRHLGMGLSRKTGGQRVPSPVGEIAEDIICHRDGHHWDVLGGAAVGNALNPGRGPSIGIIDLRARPWVEPVEPQGAVVEPDPEPGPVPTPPPAGVDLSGVLGNILQALAGILVRQDRIEEALVSKLSTAEAHALIGETLIGEHVASLYQRLEAVRAEVAAKPSGGGSCVLGRIRAGEPLEALPEAPPAPVARRSAAPVGLDVNRDIETAAAAISAFVKRYTSEEARPA